MSNAETSNAAAPQFKKVASNSSLRFVNAKALNDAGTTGTVVEGIYVGAIQNANYPDRTDFKIEESGTGATVIVNGSGNLNSQMKDVAPGTLVQINYLGMSAIKSGKYKGKKAHNFEVLTA